jgi:hypothetical protein
MVCDFLNGFGITLPSPAGAFFDLRSLGGGGSEGGLHSALNI